MLVSHSSVIESVQSHVQLEVVPNRFVPFYVYNNSNKTEQEGVE